MDSPPNGNAGETSPPAKRPRLEPEATQPAAEEAQDAQRPRLTGHVALQRLAELELREREVQARGEPEEDDGDEESMSRDIDSRPNSFDSSVAPARPPNGREQVGPTAPENPEAPENLFRKENLPPPMDHEIEFLIKNPKSYAAGQSVTSPTKTLHGCFTFRLLVFPMGTETTAPPSQVAAFVEAMTPPDCEDVRWAFEGVKYQIAVVNWKDYRKSTTQNDIWTFNREHADRGWHKTFLKAKDMSPETGWLSENGELCLRASCSSRRAMVQGPSRKPATYLGLKNHGATCYMNCLLQTLFCLGHFRHIAYSIEVPENDQAVVSSDDISDSLGFDDDRPALPLLVSLQNLFYRLQTSDGAVSCRELMRSFGWDTADAFMQHDAQELNRLLCDRLEEQMKGTPTDGEIKRLFEGEFENYIECLDVEYKSQRNETFYDLQLNVRDEAGNDITSLEDSLKDFIREEVLEGDNAYDAEGHGKQRARKGIRFKRFPPVLYIQLKRFMFDPEKMDMNKLNGKMEFPQVLDLEAFAEGSGKYMLHTVIVHSGGVSSGHYYAFVRVRDGEKTQWVKFDDEVVAFCSQEAAINDNYGGEDPNVWNYFSCTPNEIRQRAQQPGAPRIHNAYMLSYVRMESEKELLTPPVLNKEGSAYRSLIERCTREEKLAEERKRVRYEQMMRVEVKAVLEQDLMKMKGFFPNSIDEIPVWDTVKVSRDDPVEDVLSAFMELRIFARSSVDQSHAALFMLVGRPKTKQLRFKHLLPSQTLKAALNELNACGHDPKLLLLIQVSMGYDPMSLQLVSDNGEVPHELVGWTEDLLLLIVKYYCPVKEALVTLGCYYGQKSDTLKAMMDRESDWFDQRLEHFVQKNEVAQPRSDAEWACFEEYTANPKDLKQLNLERPMELEGLYCGDIIIWQPVYAPVVDIHLDGRQGPEEDSPKRCVTVKDYAEKCLNRLPIIVRLMDAEAPFCPEGIPSNLLLGMPPPYRALPVEDAGPDSRSQPESKLPGEVAAKEITIDVRWRVDKLKSVVAQALGAAEGPSTRMWLFDTGPPTVYAGAPKYTEDSAPSQTATSLLDNGSGRNGSPQRKLSLDAVILPVPPPKTHPICIRFFNDHVIEVGASIFHMPHWEDGSDEDEPPKKMRTGNPTVDPEAVLKMAREYLTSPGNEELRRKFCWVAPTPGKFSLTTEEDPDPEVPPLRLLEVVSNRILRCCRERDLRGDMEDDYDDEDDDDDDAEIWGTRNGDANFLHNAFRVEPDPAVEPNQVPAQLIEVFHMDPNHIIGCFGHPFLIPITEGASGFEFADDIEAKLLWSRRPLDPPFRGPNARCRLLMARGHTRTNERRLWQEVRFEEHWRWSQHDLEHLIRSGGPHLQSPQEELSADRPPSTVPANFHHEHMALAIERSHPLYQGRTPGVPQRTGNKPLTIKAA